MKTIFDELQQEVKNWWISLILGILYVIVAISLMFSPLSGYAVLSILFSVSMLFSGLLEISFAVSNRRRVSSWGWYLAGGIIDMILGFYLIAYPMLSMEVIPFIIAFWLMFRGFSSVGYAMDLKRYGTRDWGWYVAFGILAVICSLIILWQPAVGALYAVYMISFAFLIIGFFPINIKFISLYIADNLLKANTSSFIPLSFTMRPTKQKTNLSTEFAIEESASKETIFLSNLLVSIPLALPFQITFNFDALEMPSSINVAFTPLLTQRTSVAQ